MSNIALKTTGDAQWDALAAQIKGEVGSVTGQFQDETGVFYNGNFPVAGIELTWIPASVADIKD
jgi:hypothetical protein